MCHNMKKLNSVSQHTECYYFNDKKNHVQFPLCTAVKSVHINRGATVQPGDKVTTETHFIQVVRELVNDQKDL